MSEVNRPRICYVIPHYTRGEGQHFAHLPRFLEQLGKLADVYVIVEKGEPCDAFHNVQHVYWQRYGKANRLLRSLELAVLALKVRRYKCRRFFVRISVPAAVMLSLLGRFFRFEVYYWLSGQPTNVFPSHAGLRNHLRLMWLRIGLVPVMLALYLAHRVVTGPECMVDYFVREFNVNRSRIVVLYNDIDSIPCLVGDQKMVRQQLGLPMNRPIVLFVGRVSLLKGGYNLLPIVSLVAQHAQDVLFVIVGPVRIEGFHTQLTRSGCEKHVKLVGEVANSQVISFYRAADVFILPSESEGFPRVLIEAMATGLPAVAFDVGGVRDIVADEQQRFIVSRGDYRAFTDRVVSLLNDRELRLRQGFVSRQRVQRFATPVVARMFVDRLLRDEKSDPYHSHV